MIRNALTPGGGSPSHSGGLKSATDPNRVRSGAQFLPVGRPHGPPLQINNTNNMNNNNNKHNNHTHTHHTHYPYLRLNTSPLLRLQVNHNTYHTQTNNQSALEHRTPACTTSHMAYTAIQALRCADGALRWRVECSNVRQDVQMGCTLITCEVMLCVGERGGLEWTRVSRSRFVRFV